MSFNSNENRQLLLQLLKHNPIYLNSPDFFMANFNNIIETINNNNTSYTSLMHMNKTVIKNISELNVQLPTAKKELSKSELFQQRLSMHEQNFTETINLKKPTEIDFSDKLDDDDIKDIDETMLQREKELKEIMGKYNNDNVSNWLTSQETRDNPVTLKIKDDKSIIINTIDLEQKEKKQVRFDITEKKTESIQNLFGKLKKKSNQANEHDITQTIEELKQEIEYIKNNQNLIIEKLDKLFISKN